MSRSTRLKTSSRIDYPMELASKNRDQAYYQWVYDEVPSLRLKIDSEENEQLDVPLHPDDI